MDQSDQHKLVVIVGPTASGKSDLAVALARRFNGEVVSADSRQVYRGMDIGSGKVTKKEMAGIPHHLLSAASPRARFTVARYKKMALTAIERIQKKGKLPILCGGSAFYVSAVVDGLTIPEVPPDWRLRQQLQKKSLAQLFKTLKRLDQKRAQTIDINNPRRLIRAIEIVTKTKKPVPRIQRQPFPGQILIIGVSKSASELRKLIARRLSLRLARGMVAEVKRLHANGVAYKKLESFGLEYRHVSRYLQKKITREEMMRLIQKDSERLAKQQLFWFKKDARIVWTKNRTAAFFAVKNFLSPLETKKGAAQPPYGRREKNK